MQFSARARFISAIAALAGVAILATPAQAAHFEYVSTTYQMRYGNDDTAADVVTPQNSITNPVCAQIGAQVAVKLVTDPGDPVVNGWVWASSSLTSALDQTVFWAATSSSQTLIPVGTPVKFGNFPGFLDICHFTLHAAVSVGPLGSQKRTFAMVSQPNIYLTLGAPTAAMAVPWATILFDADSWAHKDSDATTASRHLTFQLWGWGKYDPSNIYWTNTITDTDEEFHVNGFRNSTPRYQGECNDFSDYLVCLSNSVAAVALYSQRDATLSQIRQPPYDNFLTNRFSAPGLEAQSFPFSYHQFTVGGSGKCWDSVADQSELSGSLYQSFVVDIFERGGLQMWTWPIPFLPTPLAQ